MLKEDYVLIAKKLAKSGSLRVNNFYGTLTVLAEIACFAIGLAILLKTPYFSVLYWILEIFLGISLFRFFVILHECGHKALFSYKFMNTITGTLVSPLCIIPYISWRNIHYQHHKWVGVVDKDPTQAVLLKLRENSKFTHNLFRIIWKTWFPISFFKLTFQVFWLYTLNEYKEKSYANAKAGFVSLIAIILPHILVIFYLGLVKYLIIFTPMLLIYAVWFENMNFSQHVGLFPYLSSHHPKPIPLHEQDSISRTSEMNYILAVLFCYNFNLHIEHHLFPAAPWYQLPKVKNCLESVDNLDIDYKGVGFPDFVLQLRRQDPVDIYLKTLPPHEEK
ncbi:MULTISPECIES: fatty acid desaturase family protein [Nostoc]|uniref:Fatty acid desaturase n=2 Tax=Nostoc TaxID=1177 RepID=A0ABR8IHD3_9NOSO|nr:MULTISPECIES: fatty acid desaturase [Nostoc]MBD2565333.1 fatty acid desaturase [Nostoc linckia FACHB-391]MBD2651005.1 fatty acid desaturase [Nostoc foliaceum FACHB-393]